MLIKKKDGQVVRFKEEKLVDAMTLAGASEHVIYNVLEEVYDELAGKDTTSVLEVIRLVENGLMQFDPESARNYIEYRSMRDRERDGNTSLARNVQAFIEQTDDNILNENANKSSRILSTHRDLLAGILSKDFAKHILPKHLMDAHNAGKIHIHDQDYLISSGLHNCGVYDYAGMLERGFTLGNARIESPKSVGTATTILSQICSTISGSSYGGQSIHEYDRVLLPYVEKSLTKLQIEQDKYGLPDSWVNEKLTKEIYNAHQTFIYQINTICGSNGQSAFVTISLSLSTHPLCKIIKEQYLKCHMEGLGKDKATPVFPKVIYFVKPDVNLDTNSPNHSELYLAMECSCKRMYPDFVMYDSNLKMTGNSTLITPMGCRSFVSQYCDEGVEKVTGRFNMGVTSINVAFAAIESDTKTEFFTELGKLCDLAYEANMFRINRFKYTKAKNNPILWVDGALARLDPEQSIESLIYGGRATTSIGYVGIAEAQEIMQDTSRQFGLEVIQFIKEKTKKYSEKENIAFSPYGSPAESTAYRFMSCIRKAFPDYEFEREYLTNSFHLPVWADVDIFEKLDYEKDFYLWSNGGNVNNCEVPNLANNLKAFLQIIRYAYDKVNYLIVNQPVDQCYECGYQGEFVAKVTGYHCPTCGNNNPLTISVIRRVSGYIFSPQDRPANVGKQAEIMERKKQLDIY